MLASPTNSQPRGARYPRVSHAPGIIVDSFGSVAGSLMKAARKPLEDWQQDGMDLMLSYRADGKWCCYEYAEWVARQNGKGGLGEARVLTGFFVLGEELIIWSAHEYKTALEAFRRIRTLIRALGTAISETLVEVDGVQIKISNTNGEEGFERLDTGQRIKFVARSKGSGRGFSGDVNIIDEAFAYTAEQQDALMPTLIARPNAQIVYLSSPPLTGDTGEVMFALKKRGEAADDDSLGYRDWGVEGDLDNLAKLDLDDRALWAAANPALGLGRVTFETIGRLRKAMAANGGRGFAREVLGVWPKRREGGSFISADEWSALMDAESRRDGDVALGVDISPARDYACISLYGKRMDGWGHGQIAVYAPGTDWLVAAIEQWRNTVDPVAIVMGPGTGKSLKVELKKAGIVVPEERDKSERLPGEEIKPKRGDLIILGAGEMGAACGALLDAVRQKTLRHIGQEELTTSITGVTARETNDGLQWARGKSSADTAPTVSLSLAQWGFDTRAHLVDQDGEPFNVW
ncbi:hypothetical protein [Amycolatopsis kentuckyensis]|uniref:hypothetical protein n=1 Tax=Amycolatopsis kentuckyensis TaxID=218823 RepID=UPI0011783F66|nr:hypothetical protein [Amycolatopsis kentuckyensis]